MNLTNNGRLFAFAAFLALSAGALQLHAQAAPMQSTLAQPEAVLHAADSAKLLPGSVFFRGQSATTQLRNSGGVRFADGYYALATLVDNSGYATGVQEKYQAYLINEVPLEIDGHRLEPGAYGVGIVKSEDAPRFVVMDIGAHDLFQAHAASDGKLHRPTPLQVVAAASPGVYRLYFGRYYVEFSRAK
jgi:hypothetical protein